MKRREMVWTAVLVGGLLAMSPPAIACSIFMASVGGRVLLGSNVDDGNPLTYYEVVPAPDETSIGYITLGFNDPQGGLNEDGLAFDTNAVGPAELLPRPELPLHPNGPVGIVTEILRTASTVERAIEIARQYSWGEALRNQWLFADASGDAVVIGAGADGELAFTRKAPGEGYLISTNIRRSNLAAIRFCERYRTIDLMLRRQLGRGEISVASFAEILDAAHQEAVYLRDGVLLNTVYSNVFDLDSRRITLYYWFQFDAPRTLHLSQELAGGPRRLRIRDLFPGGVVRKAAAIQSEHLERVEQLRTFLRGPSLLALAAIGAILGWALLRSK